MQPRIRILLTTKGRMNLASHSLSVIRSIHCGVKTIEPWGILGTAILLAVTLVQFNTDKKVREAIMIGLVAERLEATRSLQYEKERIARFDTGHIRMLEIMAGLGHSLSNMDLSELRLRRIQLPDASIKESDLSCSNLSHANLVGADLTDAELTSAKFRSAEIAGAEFRDADLEYTHFHKTVIEDADFTDAKFENTQLEHLDLTKAIGLTDSQINESCGQYVEFPEHIKAKLEECSGEWKNQAKEKCELNLPKSYERLKEISQDVSEMLRKID